MKNVVIMGDSFSTYKDCIPKGFRHYYGKRDREETFFAETFKLEDTWWYQMVNELNLKLVQNNSWSGSTIGYTGYGNTDCSTSSSFIYRLRQLIENGFLEENQEFSPKNE